MFDRLTLPPGWLLRLEYDPDMGSHPISLAVSQAGKGSVAMQLPLTELPDMAALQKYVDMFVSGAVDDTELGEFPPFPRLPEPREQPPIQNAPRDETGSPRPGDAFLVEGRRAPLIVDKVWASPPDECRSFTVLTADRRNWQLTRRPDTADGPPFPLFIGTEMED